MIMFSSVDTYYEDKVFLPDRNIYLSFFYSNYLGKSFFCMESYDQKYKTLPHARFKVFGIRPYLYNYKALPYKRQSSVNDLCKRVPSLRTNSFGFPLCGNYKRLEKIKSFYSSLKKQYVVIGHTRLPLNEDTEKVLLIFDRYSDALSLIDDYGYEKIKSLLGSNFKPFNSTYPYFLVNHMDHPICLFSEVSSYAGSYSLGFDWCYCLICFLRGSFNQGDLTRSIFSFVHEDNFSRIVHFNS